MKKIIKKKLVIINGVTGTIGTACLSQFCRLPNVTVIGLSRKAKNYKEFMEGRHFPERTFACSIGNISDKEDCVRFVDSIDIAVYDEVVYIHAVGVYPTELDVNGNINVSNDLDGDGIDDRVMELSYRAFFAMVEGLVNTRKPIKAFVFGSMADRHRMKVHKSWWMTMLKIKESINLTLSQYGNIAFRVVNISSVICGRELIVRPFVFQRTDAAPRFWLLPHEIAEKIVDIAKQKTYRKYLEIDLFHHASYFDRNHFRETDYNQRRMAELGIVPE